MAVNRDASIECPRCVGSGRIPQRNRPPASAPAAAGLAALALAISVGALEPAPAAVASLLATILGFAAGSWQTLR